MEHLPKENKQQKQEQNSVKPYLKYSGLAFQMIGAMVLAAYTGMKLDDQFETDNP